ncbi:MAG: hypothetical protein ACOCP4_06045, partial [Candidatus Woesearchaeota archaeon]
KKFKSDKDGRIFVLRSCDERIISSLAIGQLREIYSHKKMIILKFPQIKNNFQSFEIGIDTHSNEPTMPIQNIIYRNEIPLTNIELFRTIEYEINTLTSKAGKFDNYKGDFKDFNESFDIIYIVDNKPKKLIKLNGLNNYILIDN